LVANPFLQRFEFGPNLAIIPKVSAAYEQAAEDDPANREHILRAHRNFLRDAVYFLYSHGRVPEAAYWWKYMGDRYPEKNVLDGKPDSLPRTLTLDQYVVERVQEDVSETMSRDRVKAMIEGLLVNSFTSLAIGEDERAAGYKLLARQVRTTYESKTSARGEALEVAPIEEIERTVFDRLLDPQEGAPIEMRAVLRTLRGLPPETENSATNAPAPVKARSTPLGGSTTNAVNLK
jgi:hypothetical protein